MQQKLPTLKALLAEALTKKMQQSSDFLARQRPTLQRFANIEDFILNEEPVVRMAEEIIIKSGITKDSIIVSSSQRRRRLQ